MEGSGGDGAGEVGEVVCSRWELGSEHGYVVIEEVAVVGVFALVVVAATTLGRWYGHDGCLNCVSYHRYRIRFAVITSAIATVFAQG